MNAEVLLSAKLSRSAVHQSVLRLFCRYADFMTEQTGATLSGCLRLHSCQCVACRNTAYASYGKIAAGSLSEPAVPLLGDSRLVGAATPSLRSVVAMPLLAGLAASSRRAARRRKPAFGRFVSSSPPVPSPVGSGGTLVARSCLTAVRSLLASATCSFLA